MITKYKIFEENFNEPQLGDYIIVIPFEGELSTDLEIVNFLNNNVGVLIKIEKYVKSVDFPYYIKYENMPADWGSNCWWFTKDEVKYWSQNKADCEMYLNANKYNL